MSDARSPMMLPSIRKPGCRISGVLVNDRIVHLGATYDRTDSDGRVRTNEGVLDNRPLADRHRAPDHGVRDPGAGLIATRPSIWLRSLGPTPPDGTISESSMIRLAVSRASVASL